VMLMQVVSLNSSVGNQFTEGSIFSFEVVRF
jgi:hypothetical protein